MKTAVEQLEKQILDNWMGILTGKVNIGDFFEQAKEMEKQEKIKILKSLVYSVCIGDDVEDVEEWLQKHELNKSE